MYLSACHNKEDKSSLITSKYQNSDDKLFTKKLWLAKENVMQQSMIPIWQKITCFTDSVILNVLNVSLIM